MSEQETPVEEVPALDPDGTDEATDATTEPEVATTVSDASDEREVSRETENDGGPADARVTESGRKKDIRKNMAGNARDTAARRQKDKYGHL